MSPIDTDRFRRSLLEERQRVEDALGRLRDETAGNLEDASGEINASGVDQHPADFATATVDREIDYSLEENSGEILTAIDAALQRIDDGTYGTCVNCGKPIPEERLEALPWTELCIEDQRAQEQR